MSLWVWTIAWSAAYAIVWFWSSCVSSWSSSNFHWFYSTLSAHFRWFLKASHLPHVHHVAIYVATWKFIGRALVRISNTLILTSCILSISIIAHGMIVFICTSSYISVTLTQSSNCSKTFSFSFVLICHELSSITAI